MNRKKLLLTLALVVAALGFAQNDTARVYAAPGAIFTVNQTADLVDASLADNRCDTDLASAGDQCSLRAAIQQANASAGPDTIRFVSIAPHTLTRLGNGAGAGDLDITTDITLEPIPGGKTIITGASNFDERIFDIQESAIVTIKRLEIKGGHQDQGSGGGILIGSNARLTLEDSVVAQNSASAGGGISNVGTLTIRRTTITQNHGFDSGGLISTHILTMVDSTVSRNTATEDGGGFYNLPSASASIIVNSTLSANEAGRDGGGIFNDGGPLNLFNVTISGNTAAKNNNPDGSGGGLDNLGGTVTIINTVIANNVDLSGNDFGPDCRGVLTSNGFNSIENGNGCNITGSTTGNLNGTDPKLGRLRNNGGPTNTHAMSAGSILIDAGNPAGCQGENSAILTSDQRGFTRPTDGNADGTIRCDIGAFEVGAVGIGSVSPNRGSGAAGELVNFDLAWDSPTRWRDLTTLDLRFKRKKEILLWLRFTEGQPTSTISLLDEAGNVVDSGNVGEARKLKNEFGSVDLAQSGFTASGPDDPHVVVHFAVTFRERAGGRSRIEMLATDDFANAQGPERAGKWRVKE